MMQSMVVPIAIVAALVAAAPAVAGDELPQADTTTPSGADEPGREPDPGPDVRSRVQLALASLEDEPGLAELQRAALGRADADLASTRRWMSAPNRAALLPVLKLTAEHDWERDESLDRYQDEPDRWGADTDRDLGFQVSAQWSLGELIFSPDEVRVYGALADRAERREALLTLLVGYYYERRGLQVRLALAPPAEPLELAETLLRIDELTAEIDALTGGLLSRTLQASTSATTGRE